MLRQLYNRADLILCTSTMMQQLMMVNGCHQPVIWQRGVDTTVPVDPKKVRYWRECFTDAGKYRQVILYVGRLAEEKSLTKLKPVLASRSNTRLVLIGEGPYKRQLQRRFLGMATYFAGHFLHEDLLPCFAASDVFILPSCSETLGLVLLESMVARCPVIAANVEGVKDIVNDGENGYLFSSEQELLTKTHFLLDNSKQRQTIIDRAYQEVQSWDWQWATQQLRQCSIPI